MNTLQRCQNLGQKITKYRNDTIDQILKKNDAITDDSEEFEIFGEMSKMETFWKESDAITKNLEPPKFIISFIASEKPAEFDTLDLARNTSKSRQSDI